VKFRQYISFVSFAFLIVHGLRQFVLFMLAAEISARALMFVYQTLVHESLT